MKKNLILVTLSIVSGIAFTFFVLNRENTYAKEEYLVYAFQVGAFENEENAKSYSNYLPSSIVVKEDNLYKVYTAIYKDIDIINQMVVYFEDNEINIYLKNISVSPNFYTTLSNFEKLIKNSYDKNVYDKVNQSILNSYLESIEND